jgi:branched-chain amino acid aminotransferase
MSLYISHNGALLDADGPALPLADRGFRYGDGVYDTLRVAGGAAEHAAEHYARLVRHAGVLGLAVPLAESAWRAEIEQLVRANEAHSGVWALNTFVTRGPGPRGLAPPPDARPTVILALSKAPDDPPAPLRVIVARTTRRNAHSPLSRIKSLNYGDSVLAMAEARARGADDAILLNTAGRVSDATTANVVVERADGARVTPPPSEGVVDGTTRARLLAAGEVREAPITADELAAAPRVFLTSSVRGLVPVATLDGRPLAP